MPNISKIKVGNITYDLPCGEVITITSASGTLTQEIYNKIISSPFNKIKYHNKIYILQEENNTSYVYTSNYLTNGNRITITKSNRAISSGSLGVTAISTADINAICSQVILNSEDVDL